MRALAISVLALTFAFSSCADSEGSSANAMQWDQQEDEKKNKKDKDKKKGDKEGKQNKSGKNTAAASGNIEVLETWEMPRALAEISGSVWIGKNRIAAVQDEKGTIFIYDLVSKKVEKEIHFAGKGDYEGIAAVGNLYYVLRSDGTIFEVQEGKEPKQHDTHLTIDNDTEGLFYDQKNNRLLVALKGSDKAAPGTRSVYAFHLSSHKLGERPVITINLDDKIFSNAKNRKKGDVFRPSDLAVHPLTGELYVIDGANPSLLVMSAAGELLTYLPLDKSQFPQPEGITFSPGGELYISTEGVKSNGRIMKVKLNNDKQEEEV